MEQYSISAPELLIPAGDLEKLETAVRFGADAVYVGAGEYSLRAGIGSFSLDDLQKGIRFAHERACKVYLALNIVAYDDDLEAMLAYFRKAEAFGIDGVIVSDPGVVDLIRQQSTKVKIHLSTQANTTNSAAVKFWLNQGVSRIVLARELSLERVREIKKQVPQAELEIFVHGAMCVAYSGRCLLSRHLTGRSANRGLCAQPCRWEYQLQETMQGQKLIIEENRQGTYILNSRDLCLIEHIPELVQSGISSLKVEGRMKSVYYVAVVTRIYRQAIDAYCGDPKNYRFRPEWLTELAQISHRPYTTGFYLGKTETEETSDSAYLKGGDFVGIVEDYISEKNLLLAFGRNRFDSADELEIIDPHSVEIIKFKIMELRKSDGAVINSAHNNYHVMIKPDRSLNKVSRHSIIRKRL